MTNAPYPADAPPQNPEKPWRVTAYREARARIVELRVLGDYRNYWQANLKSWWWHHVMGYGCNTWKYNAALKENK